MMRSHSAPWGGKRCACDRSSQVILGTAVSTRKMWTGEPEDGLDLNRGVLPARAGPTAFAISISFSQGWNVSENGT